MNKLLPVFLLLLVSGIVRAQSGPFSSVELVVVPPPESVCRLQIVQDDLNTYVPPPSGISGVLAGGSANFNVTYNNEDEAEAWPQAAIDAFDYAAAIWSSHIDSPATIEVEAEWADLGGCDLMSGVRLGAAGPTFGVTFGGSPIPSTVYPIGLFNALSGSDQFPAYSDISAFFNRACDDVEADLWYFGIDGNTPSGKIDFVSVVLHELGHGLGFTGSASVDDGVDDAECGGVAGNGCFDATPNVYDRFAFDAGAAGTPLLDTNTYPNPSATLGAILIGSSAFFDGASTAGANGDAAPPLYGPSTWEKGSSFSHLDESSYNGSPHALMTPVISTQEANHSPGAITCGIFQDMGWPVGVDCLSLLPVELTSFDALLAGSKVMLEWITASETNNAGFDVEIASSDGPFEKAAFIPGAGNTDVRHTYRYDWTAPEPGIYRFRLKQIDFDGQSSFSDEIQLRIELDEPFRISSPFPNPFNPSTQFEVTLAVDQEVNIFVIDALGREVDQIYQGKLTAHQPQRFSFDAESLPSGTYWIRVRGESFQESQSVLLTK